MATPRLLFWAAVLVGLTIPRGLTREVSGAGPQTLESHSFAFREEEKGLPVAAANGYALSRDRRGMNGGWAHPCVTEVTAALLQYAEQYILQLFRGVLNGIMYGRMWSQMHSTRGITWAFCPMLSWKYFSMYVYGRAHNLFICKCSSMGVPGVRLGQSCNYQVSIMHMPPPYGCGFHCSYCYSHENS